MSRDSTLTLFQVQISFAVFPDSKVDSGKKKGFSYFDSCFDHREKSYMCCELSHSVPR